MRDTRGDVEADTLLKVVLVLTIIWLALEVLFETLRFVLAPLPEIFGLLLIVLVVRYLLDRL
jgi:predicted RND superfamily exporter protein